MYCWVRYRHPVTGNSYYFVKFSDDGVKPVGCFPYRHTLGKSKRFNTKKEAKVVAARLTSLGYSVSINSQSQK